MSTIRPIAENRPWAIGLAGAAIRFAYCARRARGSPIRPRILRHAAVVRRADERKRNPPYRRRHTVVLGRGAMRFAYCALRAFAGSDPTRNKSYGTPQAE